MEKRRSKFIIFFTLFATLVITGLIFIGAYRIGKPKTGTTSFAAENSPPPTDKNSKVDISAPDGKYTFSVENKILDNGNLTQTFSMTNEADKTTAVIYTKESAKENVITVPYNSFSPDDKYIFLEYPSGGKLIHIVLRTDGLDIKTDNKFVEIESSFSQKNPDYKITEVTGWGGINLIVFNTNNKDGELGPSWWYDVTSFSFILLSTRFN